MFEHRGLNDSRAGVMRFELFREVLEDVTAFLSQGRARHYTGTLSSVAFISFGDALTQVQVARVKIAFSRKLASKREKEKRDERANN